MNKITNDQQNLLVLDLLKAVQWNEQGPRTRLLSDNGDVRVILLTLRAGQELKEHLSPSQLLVQVIEGSVAFAAAEEHVTLHTGMLCQLTAGLPHQLRAEKDTVLLLIMTPSPARKQRDVS
jgi:quercetin dioxygenase-like cupin family protein